MNNDISAVGRDALRHKQFKTGLWLCWLALLITPIGLLATGGGPCAGPRNALGSAILFTIGAACIAAGIWGIVAIIRGINSASAAMRFLGVLSFIGAGLGSLVGAAYLFVGYEALQVFLRY